MNETRRRAAAFGMSAFLLLPLALGTAPPPDSRSTLAWFQKTEQALMDAVAAGDADAWNRVMDERCIVTTEEGEVRSKAAFLKDVRPLPRGLTGEIAVKELTVDEFPTFALVRYLADESEIVFGQRLATKYRVTDTFRRTRSTWKMVASHVSVVTADPPPQPVSTAGFPGYWSAAISSCLMAGRFTSRCATASWSADATRRRSRA